VEKINPINLQAIYVMWLRQVKRFIRAKSRLIASVIQPFFFLSILGLGFMRVKMPGIPENLNYMGFLVPGMVTMSVIFSSMFAGVSVIWDRKFGFLQEVLVAPVSRLSIIIGRTFGGCTEALIQGFIILAAGVCLGAKISPLGLLPAIAMMVLTAFSAVGFGLAVASKLEDIHGFQLIMSLLVMPLVLLSTAFFPIEAAPEALRYLIYFNPLTYAVDGIRGCLIQSSSIPILIDFTVITSLCIVIMSLGAYFFTKCEV